MRKIHRLLCLLYLTIPSFMTAAGPYQGKLTIRDIPSDSIALFIKGFIQLFLAAAGLLSMLFLIIGGLQMITATGNAQKVETAKKTLTYAIIGLLVVVLTFTVYRVIINGVLPIITK